jgi:hypothetical protein
MLSLMLLSPQACFDFNLLFLRQTLLVRYLATWAAHLASADGTLLKGGERENKKAKQIKKKVSSFTSCSGSFLIGSSDFDNGITPMPSVPIPLIGPIAESGDRQDILRGDKVNDLVPLKDQEPQRGSWWALAYIPNRDERFIF